MIHFAEPTKEDHRLVGETDPEEYQFHYEHKREPCELRAHRMTATSHHIVFWGWSKDGGWIIKEMLLANRVSWLEQERIEP